MRGWHWYEEGTEKTEQGRSQISQATEAARGEIYHARRGAEAGGTARFEPDVQGRDGARRRGGEIVHLHPRRLVGQGYLGGV